ncbi:MAG: DNA translocase FtsK 4TM domain-containing protein [Patescibacteria group bacterium]|nr:DNA translocase FtsK 4TM domain-containing protein [Patescibacteria group bacterium]
MRNLRRKKNFSLNLNLDAQTKKGIATVICFALAIFILLSLFDLAGSVGMALDQALSHIFGWDKIVVPFFILAAAIFLLSPERLPLKISNGIGFTLFFVGLNPLVHLLTFGAEMPAGASVDAAAGKLGYMLADPFIPIFGEAGTIIFFAALFAVSLVLIFNTSLGTILQWIMTLLRGLKTVLIWLGKPFVWLFNLIKESRAKRAETPAYEPQSYQMQMAAQPELASKQEKAQTDDEEEVESDGEGEKAPPPKPKRHRAKVEIPLELLNRHDQKPTSGDIVARQSVIQRTLETFGIPVEMGEVSVGPTVTQFTFKPADGIKLNKITALHNDLALALAAHPIRIEAPIPGKSLVGIEVPNQSVAIVGLRELFETREWRDRRSAINFALGRDVSGKPWTGDIAKMPHLLVAGATGSGKSVCLNTIIMSLLYSNGPDDLKLILVDPKRVEFPIYNGIPHLITPVITEVDKTVNAMKWAVREMNRRFDLLSKQQARDIGSYNQRVQDKLPYLVMIIDELADLMVTNKQEVESQIVRLAQMSRAVGIHLVLATQRPSVDVITGLIKANIPARVAFSVASQMDSRTILDQSGAEKLIGRGDMLYSTAEMTSPRRIQGVYVADDEINRVVEYIKSKYDPADYDETVVERGGTPTAFTNNGIADEDSDVLLPAAKEEIIRAGKASASLLQRRLKVGYARAARLLDLLEQEGFIGPADGAKPREILKVEFTKGMDQIPAPINHAALEQVNREIPDIEEEV